MIALDGFRRVDADQPHALAGGQEQRVAVVDVLHLVIAGRQRGLFCRFGAGGPEPQGHEQHQAQPDQPGPARPPKAARPPDVPGRS